MANLRTEEKISAEIEYQNKLLNDGRRTEKTKIPIKQEINKLQKELNDLQSGTVDLEKDIGKLIDNRIKQGKILATQNSAASKLKLMIVGQEQQVLEIIKKHKKEGGIVTKGMMDQVNTIESLGSGLNDISGIIVAQNEEAERALERAKEKEQLQLDYAKENEELAKLALADKIKALDVEEESAEIFKKILEDRKEDLQLKKAEASRLSFLNKLTFGMAGKVKELKEEWKEASGSTKGFIVGGIGLSAVFGTIAKVSKGFAETIDKIGETFGSLNNLGDDLTTSIVDASTEVTNLGFGVGDVTSVMSTLSSEFGVSLDEAANLSAEILKTAKATGLSVEEATKLTGELRIIAGLSQEQSEALIEGTAQLAKQAGVAPQQVLKDIAGSSETIATFTKDSGENLFEAAVAARQFGLNIDTIAKSARGVLDFETSIANEIEASVLLGKQLNLQKARELSLSKDVAGFQDEIKNQLDGIGDFNKLNVFQQEALAKALNMSVSQVAKLSSGTEKLSVAGALSAGSFDDLAGQEALSNLSKLTGQFKELTTTFMNALGPVLMDILGNVNEFLGKEENITAMKDTVVSFANALGFVAKNINYVLGAIVGLKAGFIVFDILQKKAMAASIASAIQGGSAAGAAAGPAAPIVMPLMIASLIAAVTAAAASTLIPSIDDGGVTKDGTIISSAKGSVQLNNADSVVFGTNLDGNSSDTKSASAEGQKRIENILTQGFQNLTAATLAPMPLKFAMMNGDILAKTADKIGGELNPYG